MDRGEELIKLLVFNPKDRRPIKLFYKSHVFAQNPSVGLFDEIVQNVAAVKLAPHRWRRNRIKLYDVVWIHHALKLHPWIRTKTTNTQLIGYVDDIYANVINNTVLFNQNLEKRIDIGVSYCKSLCAVLPMYPHEQRKNIIYIIDYYLQQFNLSAVLKIPYVYRDTMSYLKQDAREHNSKISKHAVEY